MGQASSALGKHSTAKEVVDRFNSNLAGKEGARTHTILRENRGASSLRPSTGKLAVVTGGNSGIGTETAKVLALAGCRVIISSRSVPAGEAAVAQMSATVEESGYPPGTAIPADRIAVRALDLESLASVRAFADSLASEPAIDFLILNAGVMAVPKAEYTQHGFERQIGTNHFGHFYLVSVG